MHTPPEADMLECIHASANEHAMQDFNNPCMRAQTHISKHATQSGRARLTFARC